MPQDLKREAAAAWRRFVSCVRLLPPDQAMMMWQAVSVEVEAVRANARAASLNP
jgi:hypothetical protein